MCVRESERVRERARAREMGVPSLVLCEEESLLSRDVTYTYSSLHAPSNPFYFKQAHSPPIAPKLSAPHD